MTFDTENEFYVKEAKDMVNIVHRLIADGKYTKPVLLLSRNELGNADGSSACLRRPGR